MTTLARTSRLVLATVVAASALLLSGCAVIPNTPSGSYAGHPEEADRSSEGGPDEAQVAWISGGQKIALTLFGSSTCPPKGSSIHVVEKADEGNAVRIDLAPLPDQPCTADFVPFTTEFWTPANVTTTQPLQVVVGEEVLILPIK